MNKIIIAVGAGLVTIAGVVTGVVIRKNKTAKGKTYEGDYAVKNREEITIA